MSYAITSEQYSRFPFEFNEVTIVTKELGANIGAVWSEILKGDIETLNKVRGFVSRGNNVYALVSDSYEDSFNFIDWVNNSLSFKSKVSINPFNYRLVFGNGVLPRSIEDIISELESVKGRVQESVVSSIDYSSYDDEGATSVLLEDYFVLSGDGVSFSVFDEGAEYTLGRGSAANFHLVGKGISREHIKLRYSNGNLQVYDLGSTNGTRVNGEKIPSRSWYTVPTGGTIRVGRVSLSTRRVEE